MNIPITKDGLKDSCCMGIYFLDTVKTTFGYSSRECRNLLDADYSRIGDNKKIQLIINPIKKNECKECNPIDCNTRPIYGLITNDIDNSELIGEKYPSCKDKRQKIEKVIDEYYPVSMEGHYDLLIVFEEGNMFFFDHVMCGSLR